MKRTFEDTLNEWTNTCLQENKELGVPEAIMLVTRLGGLGQRLIYEAYRHGQESIVNKLQEVREAEPKTGTLHGLPTN